MSTLVIMVEWLNVWWSKSMSMKQTRFTKITVKLKLYFIFYIMMLLYLNLCVKLWLFVFKKRDL